MKVPAPRLWMPLALALLSGGGRAQQAELMLVNFDVPAPLPAGTLARSRPLVSPYRWQGTAPQDSPRLLRNSLGASLARSGVFQPSTAATLSAAAVEVKDVVGAGSVTFLGNRVSLLRGRGAIALTDRAGMQHGFDGAPKLTVMMGFIDRQSRFSIEVNSALLATDPDHPAEDDYRVVVDRLPPDLQVSKTTNADGRIVLNFVTGDATIRDQALSFELYRTFPELNATLYGDEYLLRSYGPAVPPGSPVARQVTIQDSNLRWTQINSLFYPGRPARIALSRPPLRDILAGFKLAPTVFKDPAQAITDGNLGRKNGYTLSQDTPLFRAIQDTASCVSNIVSVDGDDFSHGAHGWVFGSSAPCYNIPNWQHEGTDFHALPGQPIYAMLPGVVYAAYRARDTSIQSGGIVEVKLGRFSDRSGYLNDVVMRYLHLDSCRLQVRPGETVKAGQLLGYVSRGGGKPCGISFGPHFHLDVKVLRSRPATNTNVADYYFVDSMLFVNQVYRYLQNVPGSGSTSTPDQAPKFTGWNLVGCVQGGQSRPALLAGTGVNRCDITVDTVPNGARLVRAEFAYELYYRGAGGQSVRVAIPDTDVWDARTAASPVTYRAAGAQLRFGLPLSVRRRQDRAYHELRVIGRLYFDNSSSKALVQAIRVQ